MDVNATRYDAKSKGPQLFEIAVDQTIDEPNCSHTKGAILIFDLVYDVRGQTTAIAPECGF